VLTDAEIVTALRRELFQGRDSELLALYVFGSTASGTQRADSDLDLAFLPAGPIEPKRTFDAAQELARLDGRDVDLIDLSRASTVFRAQVVSAGRPVLTADARRVGEFEMYALSDYARLNEERREAVDVFLERYRD